jgi:hypothetical protein
MMERREGLSRARRAVQQDPTNARSHDVIEVFPARTNLFSHHVSFGRGLPKVATLE